MRSGASSTRGSAATGRGRVTRGPRSSDRPGPGADTRELILSTAERLFAERGVTVSSRQIAEEAEQANNSAVAYHFGSKNDLVLAIVRRHAPSIERRQSEMLEAIRGSNALRDWLSCLVHPITEHLESLGTPSWYARFLAQVTTDPAIRQVVFDETFASGPMRAAIEGTARVLPVAPPEIHEERGDMTRHLIVHVCAERERALQAGLVTARPSWDDAAVGLVDALVGLWAAPITRSPRAPRRSAGRRR